MNRVIPKILSVLMTIVICILMVSLVCSVVIYLFGFSRTPTYELDADTIRQARESENKIDLTDYLDYRIVAPCFSAVCSSTGVDYCFIGGNESQQNFYNQIDDVIYALFNENTKVTFISENEGNDIWKERLLGDGVFLEWMSYVRKSAIFYNLFPDLYGQNISNEAIKCIMIYPVEDGFEAMAKVGADGFALYKPSENTSVSFNYKRIEMEYPLTFKFAASDSTIDESFNTQINVLPECLLIDELTRSDLNIVSTLKPDNQSPYLNAFKINTVKASSYIDDAKNYVYVDEDTTLVIGEKGVFYNSDTRNGIHISSFIGNSDEYEIKDYLCICNKLLHDLQIDIETTNIFISDIYYSNDYLTVSYGFKYDNVPLQFGGVSNPIKFVFKDNVLVSASVYNYSISEAETQTSIIQYLSMVSYLLKDEKGNVDFRLFYNSENGVEIISWMAQHEEYSVPGEEP